MNKWNPRYPHSQLVKCLDCGLTWERIIVPAEATYTILNEDVQYNCPKCGSNAFEKVL